MVITKDIVKEKSEEFGLSFSDLLRGLALEDLIYLLFENKKDILLDNINILGLQAYASTKEVPICISLLSDVLPGDWLKEVKEILKDKESSAGFHWVVQDMSTLDGCLILVANLLDMKVPLCLRVRNAKMKATATKKYAFCGSLRKEPVDITVAAPEQELAQDIERILERMELIDSMEYYANAWEILQKYAVDGRKIAEELKLFAKDKRIEEGRADKIAAYAGYHYMRKRWNSYQKRADVDARTWEELVAYLMQFIQPIWDSVCKDQVFIGDWMPELGKFL